MFGSPLSLGEWVFFVLIIIIIIVLIKASP